MLTVASLCVHPVKSLHRIDLTEAQVTRRGIEHDRRWMLVDEHGDFINQRDYLVMATIRPEIEENALVFHAEGRTPLRTPLRPDGSRLTVTVWDIPCEGVAVGEEADAWFEAILGTKCRLVWMPDDFERPVADKYQVRDDVVGFADKCPLLLTTNASLGALNENLAEAIPITRFRSNIVVSGGSAWDEDTWTKIRVGDVEFHGVGDCGRCSMTTTDQETGTRSNTEPLATLARIRLRGREALFGRLLTPADEGVIRVGDRIEVLERGEKES